jgi:tetratricopeptide (TPR) repeat protein
MKWAYLLAFLSLAAMAQTTVVLRDGNGKELRRAAGVAISSGEVVAVSRSALLGASLGEVVDAQGRLYAIAAVSADDQNADLALLVITKGLPSGVLRTAELEPGLVLVGASFAAKVDKQRDVPEFGPVYQLRLEKNHPPFGAPLWNERGELVGWYVPKVVDGQRFSFALPASRVLCLSSKGSVSLTGWNAGRRQDAEQQYALSMGYFWLQDFDGSSYHFNKAAEANRDNPQAWFYLAFSEGKMGRTRKKIEDYRKAISLEPGFARARFNLGFGLLLNGDRAGAQAECDTLRTVDVYLAERLQAFIEVIHVDPFPNKAMPNESERPLKLVAPTTIAAPVR